VIQPSCGQCDGLLEANVTGGAPGTTYSWTPSIGLSSNTIYNPSVCEPTGSPVTYYCQVVDANGCFSLVSAVIQSGLPCDSVYPGDTDYDGFADNNDLLPIGLAYLSNGPGRVGASLNWVGQIAQNWWDTIPGGTNQKHVDTDGNGIVEDADTLAILQNYGYAHSGGSGLTRGGPNDPDLYFDLTLDTISTSQPLTVPLFYGTSSMPADSVYGLAFTINYDPGLVDSTQPIYMDFSQSWLGTVGTDALSIQYLIQGQGELDVAITRTDGNSLTGYGLFGELNVVTTDNLSGIQEYEYDNHF